MKKICIIIIIACSVLYPQNITVDTNKDFEKALSFYNSKKYNDALNLFEKIAIRIENNTKNTASAFFVSKILVYQKKYFEAEKSINDFLKDYPQSKYANEVKYLLIKMPLDSKSNSQNHSLWK